MNNKVKTSLKALTVAVFQGLFWWGGYNFKASRRFIAPFVLSVACAIILRLWYVIPLMCPAMLVFSLGYGDNSRFRHIFGDGWGRSVWGLLGALALSLGLFLTGHLAWYFFLPYLVLNFILENALKNLKQWLGDPIIGVGFGCIVFLIK